MSKTIDLSGGVEDLSEDDLLYLAVRDDQAAMAELEKRGIGINQSEPKSLEEYANTGDANTSGETIEELEARLAQMKAEQSGDDDDEALEPPYDQYKNDDLRSEIVRRNESRDEDTKLSLEGRKDELIATLEDDDEED